MAPTRATDHGLLTTGCHWAVVMSSDKDLQSIEQAKQLVEHAYNAQKSLAGFPQEKVDAIVGAMARAASLTPSASVRWLTLRQATVRPRTKQPRTDFQRNRFTTSSGRCERSACFVRPTASSR